ncbi:Protein of unknown function [Gryllus bimaculatus]|nr:Protein of unknown function [Gryllus bimaculatus]
MYLMFVIYTYMMPDHFSREYHVKQLTRINNYLSFVQYPYGYFVDYLQYNCFTFSFKINLSLKIPSSVMSKILTEHLKRHENHLC